MGHFGKRPSTADIGERNEQSCIAPRLAQRAHDRRFTLGGAGGADAMDDPGEFLLGRPGKQGAQADKIGARDFPQERRTLGHAFEHAQGAGIFPEESRELADELFAGTRERPVELGRRGLGRKRAGRLGEARGERQKAVGFRLA